MHAPPALPHASLATWTWVRRSPLLPGLRRKGAHLADSELQRLMANVDLDGSNTLDFDEFLTGVGPA